jgi:hypothetical protein
VFSVSFSSLRSRARDGIVDHVLEDRPEAPRGREDLRLGVGREADHLGVAAVLEVEHARGAPAVLVVADEAARRVGAESVVFPVPERPKKIAESPVAPTFAEQCIARTPSSGSR